MNNDEINELLKQCANEPIQFLKSIQFYGKLIAADIKDLSIRVVSENHHVLLSSHPFDKSLDDYFTKEDIENVIKFIHTSKYVSDFPLELTFKKTNKTHLYHLNKTEDLVVLEEESVKSDYSEFPKEHLVNSLTNVHLVDSTEESIYSYAEQVLRNTIQNSVKFTNKNGEIEIFSEGKELGTTVTIKLPISSTAPEKNDNTSSFDSHLSNRIEQSLSGLKVLLVEDTIESARFVTIFLESAGANVTWLDNAKSALTILESEFSYDVVISDISLPEMDGHEFVTNAKKIEHYKSIPFIALSAYGTIDEIKKSIDHGYSKHLVKPIQLDELIKDIKGILK